MGFFIGMLFHDATLSFVGQHQSHDCANHGGLYVERVLRPSFFNLKFVERVSCTGFKHRVQPWMMLLARFSKPCAVS